MSFLLPVNTKITLRDEGVTGRSYIQKINIFVISYAYIISIIHDIHLKGGSK